MALDRKMEAPELHPEYINIYEQGVKLLEEAKLLNEETHSLLLQKSGEHAVRIAEGLIRLNKNKALEKNLKFLVKKPENALGMLFLLNELEFATRLTETNRTLIKKYNLPISVILNHLIENNLVNQGDSISVQKNFYHIIKHIKVSEYIALALRSLAGANKKLVTQENFNVLITNINKIHFLSVALEMLAKAKLLNQENFNRLIGHMHHINEISFGLFKLGEQVELITQENFEYLLTHKGRYGTRLAKGFIDLHNAKILSDHTKTKLTESKKITDVVKIFNLLNDAKIFTSENQDLVVQYEKHPKFLSNLYLLFDCMYNAISHGEEQIDLSKSQENFDTLITYIAFHEQLSLLLLEDRMFINQVVFDQAITKINEERIATREAFLMGAHQKIGSSSAVRTFFKSDTFDRNSMHIVFDFLDYKPKLNRKI